MIRRIVQKIRNQKNGEIGEILLRPGEKKMRLRAFARTRAKIKATALVRVPIPDCVEVFHVGNLIPK